jgi:hyperosmotically inducible periplasmic protein
MVMHQLVVTLIIATALPAYQADNTERNKQDRDGSTMTAEKQGNSKADVDLAARIRRSVVKDKSLSVTAQNVKIVVQDGRVWLRGPVKTAAEKDRIEELARKSAGSQNVSSYLEVSKGDS